jgi:hypothetical protein
MNEIVLRRMTNEAVKVYIIMQPCPCTQLAVVMDDTGRCEFWQHVRGHAAVLVQAHAHPLDL